MKNRIIISILFCVVMVSCKKPSYSKHTSIKFLDPHRLYSPIVQGQTLKMSYKFENTGEYPLLIEDVQTSCGCIVTDYSNDAVGAGNQGYVELTYDSKMNTGFVNHYVTIIANVDSTLTKNISFQVNVVSNYDHIKDHQQGFFTNQVLDENEHLYEPLENEKVINDLKLK